MELWIRSQNKEKLIKANNIEIFHHYSYKDTQEKYLLPSGSFEYRKVQKKDKYIKSVIMCNDEINLGEYKTKERALEVLDEIQNKIKQQFIVKSSALRSLEDIDKEENRLIWKYDKEFIMQDSGFEIVPINDGIIVYEMPEE